MDERDLTDDKGLSGCEIGLKYQGKRRAIEQNLKAGKHLGALASLDALHASLWLLFFGQLSQSLMQLFNAIEIAMKAVLKEKHPDLLLEINRNGKNEQKVEDAVKYVLSGGGAGRPSNAPAPRRTCDPLEAHTRLDRVKVKIPSLILRTAGYSTIRDLRNAIQHSGPEETKQFEYLEAILLIGWPSLCEVFQQGFHVALAEWIGDPLAQEMGVAKAYLAEVRNDPTLPADPSTILTTYACQFRFFYKGEVERQAMFAFSASKLKDIWVFSEEEICEHDAIRTQWREARHRQMRSKWGRCIDLVCRICAEAGLVAAVALPRAGEAPSALVAEGLLCTHCGLYVPTTASRLADLHYGPITKDVAGGPFAPEGFFPPSSGPEQA